MSTQKKLGENWEKFGKILGKNSDFFGKILGRVQEYFREQFGRRDCQNLSGMIFGSMNLGGIMMMIF